MADYVSDYSGQEIDAAIEKVHNADSTPTAGSEKMVKSGGVKAALNLKTDDNTLAAVAKSGSYNDLTNKPDLSHFITKTVSDLTNYYLKSETYTKAEVQALIGAINQFHYEIYASTSAVDDPQSNVLYLIGPTGSGSDRYEEYVYTTTWVKIGDTSIDLSGYVTTEALNTALANYVTSAAFTEYMTAYTSSLTGGTIVPKLAGDLESWADRAALSVSDTFSDIVRTTAGDTSIDSSKGAKIISLVAKTNFYASAFKLTGFNLLHNATAVGNGYYFLVPALPFGTFGTAEKPNGILFTTSAGAKMTPTVYFKPLADGVPTGVTDGTACPYTDSNGYRFYNPPAAGYLIASPITLATTCAHVAWSRRYDEYISPTAAADAGSSVNLATIIAAIHNTNLMYVCGPVADRIDFGASIATWTRKVDRVAPATWTTVQNEDESYTHSATISGMKENGYAECGNLALNVNGTTVSYTDSSSSATSDYVYYELAMQATGTVSLSHSLNVEDWGLEYFQGATGSAYVTMQYAQGYPDSLAALVSGVLDGDFRVVAEAITSLFTMVGNIQKSFITGLAYLKVINLDIRSLWGLIIDSNIILKGASAPSASVVPEKWNYDKYGEWMGIPQFIGQVYIDTTNKIIYMAAGSSAVTDWQRISNA